MGARIRGGKCTCIHMSTLGHSNALKWLFRANLGIPGRATVPMIVELVSQSLSWEHKPNPLSSIEQPEKQGKSAEPGWEKGGSRSLSERLEWGSEDRSITIQGPLPGYWRGSKCPEENYCLYSLFYC